MKFPQIPIFVALFLSCFFLSHAQTNSLNTLTTTVYLEKAVPDIKSTLNTENYATLFEAFKAANLEEILGMSGPFTLFAPSNSAFDRFSSSEWEELFKEENRTKLKDLLTYHLVAGNLTASKMLRALCRGEGKASFTSVQGTKIFATMQGTDIVLSDASGNEARITSADANQSNGIIHHIDRVILPMEP